MKLPSLFSRLPGKRWFGALLRRSRQARGQRRRKLLKVALWVVGLVALFAVVGFFAVPPIAKHYLVKSLSELLNRQVAIQDIKINPFALTASVRGFMVSEPGGSEVFVSFDELFVDLQAESVIQRGPILREIRLEHPFVHVVRRDDGTYNFSDLLVKFTSGKPAAADQAKQQERPRFSLNNIEVIAGKVIFDDQPKRAKHAVTDLDIAIPFLSNLPYRLDQYVVPSFSAKVNDTPIALTGRSKPFATPPEAQLDVNVYSLDIPRYLEYLPVKLPFKITSALLETRLTATFKLYPDMPPLLVLSGKVALDTGEVVRVSYADQNGHPYRSVGRLLVERGELTLDQASMQGIKAWGSRNPDKLPELLNANASYVFFREQPASSSGPSGALGVPLTAGRSVAVDPRAVPLGAPVFLSTTWPNSTLPLNRLMMAQDTGGAIKGAVRADFYWGSGDEAGAQAGRMRQTGRIWVLLPNGFPLNP
jgi:3D (Asp-Asp-Asp) domain-containing protein